MEHACFYLNLCLLLIGTVDFAAVNHFNTWYVADSNMTVGPFMGVQCEGENPTVVPPGNAYFLTLLKQALKKRLLKYIFFNILLRRVYKC